MFKAYFDDLADIGDLDTVVPVGAEIGLPETDLRAALTSGRYRDEVDEGIRWAQQLGVTAVPTFVLGEKYGIVGAQEAGVFENLPERKFGRSPRR